MARKKHMIEEPVYPPLHTPQRHGAGIIGDLRISSSGTRKYSHIEAEVFCQRYLATSTTVSPAQNATYAATFPKYPHRHPHHLHPPS